MENEVNEIELSLAQGQVCLQPAAPAAPRQPAVQPVRMSVPHFSLIASPSLSELRTCSDTARTLWRDVPDENVKRGDAYPDAQDYR